MPEPYNFNERSESHDKIFEKSYFPTNISSSKFYLGQRPSTYKTKPILSRSTFGDRKNVYDREVRNRLEKSLQKECVLKSEVEKLQLENVKLKKDCEFKDDEISQTKLLLS